MPIDSSVADAGLIQKVVQGDREAFAQLYDRHASRVYGLAVRILGETMAAEEVTQDTFMKLWTRAKSFSPDKGTLVTWLLTIARRTALDRVRLEDRRPDFGNPVDPELAWKYHPDPDTETDETRWRSLFFALHELPLEQRQTIELSYYQGLSQSQIADYLDVPVGTIKTRMRLGMEKLRQIWTAADPKPNERT
jgi:RNA polymerase sigma-70 factor (ECF subfamily)